VDNPLCGPRGATAVFGPQKGLGSEEIAPLDALMARYARLAEAALGREAQHRPGAGAAGGLGFALQLLGAEFRSGAEVVATVIGLDAALAGADWLFTGEGRSDAQTLAGKAPCVAAAHARAGGVPTILVSGGIDRAALPLLSAHFAACFALPFGPMALPEALVDARTLLADSARQIAQLMRAAAFRVSG
jgi:glycerate kinase